MSKGWIYLRKNVNLKGEAMAYCIGKTGNEKKRRKTYQKENPFIEHMEDYKASDMHTAETILRDFIKDNEMQLVGRSAEWLRKECFEEFYQKWLKVKCEWWVNKPKPPKREYIKPIGAGSVKPLPPVGKPRPLENWTEKEHLIAYVQEAARTPPPVPMASVTAQSIAPATDETPALLQALGEVIAVTFTLAVGVGVIGICFHLGKILIALVPILLCVAFMWVLGTLFAPKTP